jgi:hypothetical protein
MKRTTLITLLVLAAPLAVLAGNQGEAAWLDLENCAFCKNLTEDPALMEHLTWETHKIDDGMLTITTVDPAYHKSYKTAVKKMQALGEKMQNGEVNPMTVEMCGHCQNWGMLAMAGAHMEAVYGEAVEVTLLTSDDPKIVAKIHTFAQHNIDEMTKMASHAGHEHEAH